MLGSFLFVLYREETKNVIISFLAASAVSYLVAAWAGGRANAVTLTEIQLPALAAALVTAQIGAAMGVTSIRDRQLFAFFKNRQ